MCSNGDTTSTGTRPDFFCPLSDLASGDRTFATLELGLVNHEGTVDSLRQQGQRATLCTKIK
jgi:hypothetical protein